MLSPRTHTYCFRHRIYITRISMLIINTRWVVIILQQTQLIVLEPAFTTWGYSDAREPWRREPFEVGLEEFPQKNFDFLYRTIHRQLQNPPKNKNFIAFLHQLRDLLSKSGGIWEYPQDPRGSAPDSQARPVRRRPRDVIDWRTETHCPFVFSSLS